MAVIALLVGRSQSFASLHLYWVWALLVHPTPKNQSFPMCPPYIPISNLLFQVHSSCFYLSFKLNFCVMWKFVIKALTNLTAHFTFLLFNKFDHCGPLMLMLYLQVVNWKLAQPCCHGASFQHCTFFHLVDIVIFCLWILAMWNKLETCELMEFVYVLEKCLGR
jgi:hypothetical protein